VKTLTAVALCLTASAYGGTCGFPAGTLVVPPTQNAATTEGFAVNGLGVLANDAPFGLTITPSLSQVTQPEVEYCDQAPGSFLMTRVLPNTTTLLGVYSAYNDTQAFAYQTLNVSSGVVSVLSSVTLGQVNPQLAAQSLQQILDFNHEVLQLPSGNTAVLAHEEELVPCTEYPAECWTGYTAPQVDILGDQVLVLDPNANLLWSWNAFSCPNCAQELSISDRAVLGEKCTQGPPEYCPITLATEADDWLHMNSISYDPADGNLVVSIRHQDAIIKIAYENGSGDGHIVWRLGHDGGFKLINSLNIPSPWFSHQHDVEVVSDNPLTLSLFDNGNTRHASNPSALSRVQVLTVNESNHTVDIAFNYDLPVYSSSYGSVQPLINGNWWALAGNIPNGSGAVYTQGYEITPAGVVVYEVEYQRWAYRSWRLTGISPFAP
jgi:hypothetical protein